MLKYIQRLITGKATITGTGAAAVGVAVILASCVILGAFLFIYSKYLKS